MALNQISLFKFKNIFKYFSLFICLVFFLSISIDSIIEGYFFLCLHSLVVITFLLFIKEILKSNFLLIYIIITSISFSFLIFDTSNYFFNFNFLKLQQPINVEIIDEGSFYEKKTRIYSKEFPSGYLFKDGLYHSKKSYLKDNKIIKIFEADYKISNGLRVKNDKSINHFCSDVILLGGSHNFGWGLDFDDTLQGMLESQDLSTINLSIPGFGLNNSLAILIDNNEQVNCKSSDKEILILYRAIDDHVNRNVGKTSFNIHGPNFFHQKSEVNSSFISNCNNIFQCISYLKKYVITRMSFYLLTSKYEKSSNILGGQISKRWFYAEDDFVKTQKLLETLITFSKTNYDKSKVIVLLDYADTKQGGKLRDYFEKVLDISLISFSYDEIKYSSKEIKKKYKTSLMVEEICKNNKELTFKYDYHPTKCYNSLIYEIIHQNLL